MPAQVREPRGGGGRRRGRSRRPTGARTQASSRFPSSFPTVRETSVRGASVAEEGCAEGDLDIEPSPVPFKKVDDCLEPAPGRLVSQESFLLGEATGQNGRIRVKAPCIYRTEEAGETDRAPERAALVRAAADSRPCRRDDFSGSSLVARRSAVRRRATPARGALAGTAARRNRERAGRSAEGGPARSPGRLWRRLLMGRPCGGALHDRALMQVDGGSGRGCQLSVVRGATSAPASTDLESRRGLRGGVVPGRLLTRSFRVT